MVARCGVHELVINLDPGLASIGVKPNDVTVLVVLAGVVGVAVIVGVVVTSVSFNPDHRPHRPRFLNRD